LGRARPSFADLGSGGGYPGLPLAVALPARRAAVVDSIGKKAIPRSGRGRRVSTRSAPRRPPPARPGDCRARDRAEDLAEEHGQRETWTSSPRAPWARSPRWPKLGLLLVHVGGHVVCWKLADLAPVWPRRSPRRRASSRQRARTGARCPPA
jgi:16S rRNA (guanine527-N7)-methyltransferase